jgi:hypothetical protein
MRKNLKRKRRSCGLCKPNKTGWSSRWPVRELALRKETDREMRNTDA